jgi:hypothetical protein
MIESKFVCVLWLKGVITRRQLSALYSGLLFGGSFMNRNDLAVVGLRIFALYLIATGVSYYSNGSLIFAPIIMPLVGFSWYTLPPTLIYLGSAAVLWFAAPALARYVLPGEQPAETESRFTPADGYAVGFSLVGLWALVQCLPLVAEQFYYYHAVVPDQIRSEVMAGNLNRGLLVLGLRTVIGLYLLFGGRWLIAAVKKVREFGRT